MSKLIPLATTKIRLNPYSKRIVIRRLPQPEKIHVKVGDTVNPEDIIGECDITAGFRVLDIPQILNIKPEEVSQLLKRQIGQRVYRGEVLAEVQKWLGISKQELICPINGKIINLDKRGRLTVQYLPSRYRLVSGVKGTVTAVRNNESVSIDTEVAMINGALGVGYIRDGAIQILKTTDQGAGLDGKITAAHQGKILVTDSIISRDMIQRALAVGVHGLIGGGMRVRDFISAAGSLSPLEDIGISIMVVGAFGDLPLEKNLLDFIAQYEHHYAIMNPQERSLIIPLYGESKTKAMQYKSQEQNIITLAVGMKVRILYWPHFGRVGVINEIHSKETRIDSGLFTPICTVELPGNVKTNVPLRNIEVE